MNRRQLLLDTALAAAALAAGGATAAARTAERQHHARELAACRAEIRRVGDRHRATGWRDRRHLAELRSAALRYAEHHQALRRLA